MKRLCLVRHAKSSWTHPEIDDIERPLDQRGEEDAVEMAQLLKEKNIIPDRIVSSPAKRAITTAHIFADQLNFPREKIVTEPMVYDASVEDLLHVIKNMDASCESLMLFGHNPGFTWLANFLAEDHLANLPTCGVYCVDFQTDSWEQVTEVEGKVFFTEVPKHPLSRES